MKPPRLTNGKQQSHNVSGVLVSKPCCEHKNCEQQLRFDRKSSFQGATVERDSKLQIKESPSPCGLGGGDSGGNFKGSCGSQPARSTKGYPACGASCGQSGVSCTGGHLHQQDSRTKGGSNRPQDSSFHAPLLLPHLPLLHHHHHHHPPIDPHHQLDCLDAGVAIAFEGHPSTLLMTFSDGAPSGSCAVVPPLAMTESAVELAFAEPEERYQLNHHHHGSSQPPWPGTNNTRANNSNMVDSKSPQDKGNVGGKGGTILSPTRREKMDVPEPPRKGPVAANGSVGNVSRIVVGNVKNGKNITDDVKGKLSHPQRGPFRVTETESPRVKHPAKSRICDDYEVIDFGKGECQSEMIPSKQCGKDHSAGNFKTHSNTCPRNPANLAQAHEQHKKVLAEFTATHARRNGAGRPKNNTNSVHELKVECQTRAAHFDTLVRRHNGINSAPLKLVPEVKNSASSYSSHTCAHPHERSRRSGADTHTPEPKPSTMRPKEPDPIKKNNSINKCDYREPPWRSSQSRLNGTELTSHTSIIESSSKAEIAQRRGRSRSTWRTQDTGRSGASSPYRRRFASSDRSSQELRSSRPLGSSTVRSARPKQRSESTSRFPLPSTESRPSRNRNQLSELFENSLESSVGNYKASSKVDADSGTASEHIYDTIESCGCHKYAMDRIDSILKNSGKTVLEISAANYDVPRSTKVLPTDIVPGLIHAGKVNNHTNKKGFPGGQLASCLCQHSLEESDNSGSKGPAKPAVNDALKNAAYDSDSSATYATIDTPTEIDMSKANRSSNETNDKKYSTKLSTLDIKEDRRRTPDIVKCSREPRSVDPKSSGDPQRACCQCRTGSKASKSASATSAEKDSDVYQDISPPSTVIHMPLVKRLMEEKSSSRSTGLDRISSGYSGSRRDLNEIVLQEDEIYSVVEEWPSDGERFPDKRSYLNGNSNSSYFPQTVELPEAKTDSFSNKYITSPHGFSTLDPLKNLIPTQVNGSPHSEMPVTSVSCGSSSKCYTSHCSTSSPSVRVCTSVKELCSLMGNDPNAHVYIYKVNPDADVEHGPLQQTPHTVIILPRMADGASPPPVGCQECPCPAHSSDRPSCCRADDEACGTIRPTKDDRNTINKTSKKQAKKEGKMTLFQKLRRAPTVMGKNSKKAALNNNSLADQSKPNNGSRSSVDGVESEGVTFVEPHYEHQNSARYNDSGAREAALRFDYSSSWQNLLHFKQMSAAADG